MSWMEKLHETKSAATARPSLQVVFDSSSPASEEFIRTLKTRFPFLPDTYLLFLRQTDGVQLWMYVLAGSGASSFPSIWQLIKRWTPVLDSDELVPIGEDPAGRCLAITSDGKVVLVDETMDSADEAKVISGSFDNFLDGILMGNQYPMLFGGHLTADHENEWTEFLREKGWLDRT